MCPCNDGHFVEYMRGYVLDTGGYRTWSYGLSKGGSCVCVCVHAGDNNPACVLSCYASMGELLLLPVQWWRCMVVVVVAGAAVLHTGCNGCKHACIGG